MNKHTEIAVFLLPEQVIQPLRQRENKKGRERESEGKQKRKKEDFVPVATCFKLPDGRF